MPGGRRGLRKLRFESDVDLHSSLVLLPASDSSCKGAVCSSYTRAREQGEAGEASCDDAIVDDENGGTDDAVEEDDVLVRVNGEEVEGMDFHVILRLCRDCEPPIELEFKASRTGCTDDDDDDDDDDGDGDGEDNGEDGYGDDNGRDGKGRARPSDGKEADGFGGSFTKAIGRLGRTLKVQMDKGASALHGDSMSAASAGEGRRRIDVSAAPLLCKACSLAII